MKQLIQDVLNTTITVAKQRAKSKTYRFGGFVATVGFVSQYAEPLRPYLGEYFDLVMYAVAAGIMYYREVTTGPVSDK